MTDKINSWKEKVDPAFDKIIKYFIRFIESSGLPANSGWLKLEDEPLNYFLRMKMLSHRFFHITKQSCVKMVIQKYHRMSLSIRNNIPKDP
jgi:hypothetical protein